MLQTHLTALDHFVNVESYEKAEKHMKNLIKLVETRQDNGQIDKQVAKTLIQHADILIKKWQKG